MASWVYDSGISIVVITDRAHREPMRTVLTQLPHTGYAFQILPRFNSEQARRVPPPHVALLDSGSAEFQASGEMPSALKTFWSQASVILLIPVAQVPRLSFQQPFHDFIALPNTLAELELRIRFALWRTNGSAARDQLHHGPLHIDLTTYEAWVDERPVEMTYKEFELLKFFATHPRRVFSRAELLETVWESDYFGGMRTVDVHILRLRAKLGPTVGGMIHTVRNVGYRFG